MDIRGEPCLVFENRAIGREVALGRVEKEEVDINGRKDVRRYTDHGRPGRGFSGPRRFGLKAKPSAIIGVATNR
jgi:hypothetical protein